MHVLSYLFLFSPTIWGLNNMYLSFSPMTISSVATYTIGFSIESVTPTNSIVKVFFPSVVHIADSSSVACVVSSDVCNPLGTPMTCSVTNKVFTVSGAFGTDFYECSPSGSVITVQLPSITNPPTTQKSESIIVSTYDSSNILIESGTSTSMTITATAASLTSASISTSSLLNGAISTWTFSFTTSYTIPVGSQIQVVFPYWNSYIGATSSVGPLAQFINSGTPLCGAGSNIDSPLTGSYSNTLLILTITGGFLTEKTGTSSFTVASVVNPPTSEPLSGFYVNILDSAGSYFLRSSSLSVAVTTPNIVTIKSTGVIPTNQTVSTLTPVLLVFTITNPTYNGVLLDIQIPSDFVYDTTMVASGSSNIASSLTYTSLGSNTIRITNGFTAYAFKTSITVRLTSMVTPTSTTPAGSFTITTRTPLGVAIDTGSGGIFTAKVGTIYQYGPNPMVTASDLTAGATAVYTFDMYLSHIIPVNAALMITFPTEISVADHSAACNSVIVGIGSGAVCSVISKVLTVTGGFPTGFSGGRVSFTIASITNPPTTAPSSAFSAQTCTTSSCAYQVDVSASFTFTSLPASLVSVAVTPSSLVTGAITSYYFSVVTRNTVPVNGYLIILFPSGVAISDTNNAGNTCSKDTGFTSATLTCTATASSVTVSGFSSGPYAAGTLGFTINSISNPPSTASYSSFTISTYNSQNYIIDQKASGIAIVLTTANILDLVSIIPTSLVNGASTTYSFTVKVKNFTPTNAYAIIQFPSQVTVPSSTTCSSVSGVSSTTCTIATSSSVKAVFSFSGASVAAGSTIAFTVSAVKNPSNTKPTDTFMIYTYTTDGYKIDKMESGLPVATTTAATIATIQISAADSKISAVTSYTINYLPVNVHPIGTVLFITIPSELTVSSFACTPISLSSGATCALNGRVVSIYSGFPTAMTAASSVSFSISTITNPSSQITTSAWIVSAVTSDNFFIDTSINQVSTFACTLPCLGCATVPTFCISCDTTQGFPYLYDNTCNSQCKVGFFDDPGDSSKVCVACNSLCKTCATTAANCVTCHVGSANPYPYANTCNANCLSGWYGDGTQCITCTNPCKTCTSGTYCTSCAVRTTNSKQTYLQESTCVDTCPDGYTGDTSTFTCLQCTGLCATCSGTVSTCTSCISPYKLQGSICVSSCISDGTYIESPTKCSPCISPCYTCTTDVVTCTTCIASYFLFGTSCTANCPPGYVGINNKCIACTSPCDSCTKSPTTCTACIVGKLLEINTCVDSCSSGYFVDGVTCSLCDTSCRTCSGSATSCTACNSPMYLLAGQCIATCPAGSYVPTTGACLSCVAPCVTCSGNVNNCLSCPNGMVLYLGTCISQCPADTTVLVGSTCQLCNSNCNKCAVTVDTCTACAANLYIEAGVCVDSCSFGYILVNGACSACNTACYTCSGNTNTCTSCAALKYLYLSTCVSTCPQNFVPSLGKCVEIVSTGDCTTGCTASIVNNNNCDNVCNVAACAFDNGMCNVQAISCGSAKYESGGSCYSCSYPCSNCESTALTCTSCKPNSTSGAVQYLYQNNCYGTCPPKTFLAAGAIICSDCYIRCATCVTSSTLCTSCESPYLLYNNQCIINCPAGTSVQVDASNCADCSTNCLTCQTLWDTCTSCAAGLVLQDTKCQVFCNSGYYSSSGVCKVCSGCKECEASATACTSCNTGKFLSNGLCVSNCPVGTYLSTSSCVACSSTCASCSMASSCDTCIAGNYLYSGACVGSCPNGYVISLGICVVSTAISPCSTGCTTALLGNSVCDTLCNVADCNLDNLVCSSSTGSCGLGKYLNEGNCVDCLYPCKECTSDTICRACAISITTGNQLLLKGTTCVEPQTCNLGYTQVGVFCKACDPSCQECSGTVNVCTACASNILLYNGACVANCPSAVTVKSGSVCLPCASTCATCSGTYDTCVTCPAGKVLQDANCLSACLTGFTTTTASPTVCSACTGDCVTCSGETYSCTKCVSGKLLSGNACIVGCPADTTILVGSTCVPCTSPCSTCTGSATQCVLCISGYSLSGSTCVLNCPSGYESRLGVCTPYCAEGCTQALLYNDDCDNFCNVAACLYDNNVCLVSSTCPLGQYQSGGSCLPCVSPCNTCASQVYCSSCLVLGGVQQYLHKGTCYTNCPTGTYINGIVCADCDSSCGNCNSSPTACTSCPAGKYLYKSTCISSCYVGTSVLIGNTCVDCDSNCLQCSGLPTTCTKCAIGNSLSSGKCVAECPSGQTSTSASLGACVACVGCTTCLSETTYCTSCPSGKILHLNQCIDKCPTGYTNTLSSPGTCTQCSSNCVECINTISQCSACSAGLTLNAYGNCQVAATCPDGKTITPTSLTSCLDCASPCVNCKDAVDSCTSCSASMYLSGKTCLACTSPCTSCSGSATTCTGCAVGKFVSSSSTCQDCSASCASCSGTAASCLSCKPGLFLSGSMCLECDANCGTCSSTAKNCLSCKTGFFLVGTVCNACNSNCENCAGTSTSCTSCPTHQYVSSALVCVTCDSTCADCVGSSTLCTSCATGLVLIGSVCGKCLNTCETCKTDFNVCSTCVTGLTLINGVCNTCSSTCLTCAGSFSTCTSCADGRYLSGSTCPLCSSVCKTCTGTSDNCLSCNTGTSLIGTTCVTCDSPCKTCATSKSYCTSCSTGAYNKDGACFSCDSSCTSCFSSSSTCTTCVSGFYISGNTCTKCSNLCVTCEIEATRCTSCISGATLTNGVCVLACNSGTMQIGLSCVACASSCLTCAGSISTCTSCKSGIVYNNSCVDSCPVGYFVKSGGCQPCSTNCKECTSSSTNCITCNSGYRLNSNNTCEFICLPGQFSNGGVCQSCSSQCSTCYGSSIVCTSCSNSTLQLMPDGNCVEPCATGSVRVSSTAPCVSCDTSCSSCSVSTSNCTGCSDYSMYLYKGNCIPKCPSNVTAVVGRTCIDCNASCQFCDGSPYTCTTCYNGTYLYYSTCVKSCPYGYNLSGVECVACYNPNNCSELKPNGTNPNNTNPNATDTNSTNSTSSSFTGRPVPFPFSGFSVISAGIIGVTKLTAAGVNFVPSIIAVWGGVSCAAWVFLVGYLPDQGSTGSAGRRLAQVEAIGGNLVLTIAFFLILGALVFHVICNLLFSLTYSIKVSGKDRTYNYWKKSHRKINIIAIILIYCVSFHCIRILFCGLCNYDGFKVVYDKKGKVYKPLIKYGYISILCTFVPIIIAAILILTYLDTANWLWMFTLDTTILTFLLAILILIDIKRREQELLRHEYEKEMGPLPIEGEELMKGSSSVKDLIDMFPQIDLTSLIPSPPIQRKLRKKWISVSNPDSKVSTPTSHQLKRRGSFPMMADDEIELHPELLAPPEKPVEVVDEPYGEEILQKSEENEDLTMIQEESEIVLPEEPKEFEISFTEYKEPITRPNTLYYIPVDIEYRNEEFTEIVAYTEEDAPSEDEPIIATPEPVTRVEEFDIDHVVDEPKMSTENLLKDVESEAIIEAPAEGEKDLGTLDQEADIELEKALVDPSDPELITVPHKETGQRITIRKGFRGARIVDLENKVIDSLAPIDPAKYEVSRTVVDDSDVHFATMTARTGEKVRVKRSFKGARIVDLEKKVSHPHAYLIGQSIKNESDFQFSNAYPDPDDPEMVVVMHNETGEDVKIRKTFHGAQVVDEAGEPVLNAPGIDRNDYDIPKTIVDKEDVHLATLKHKVTNAKVKVRRNFRGAKIVDLERKADMPRALNTILSEKSDEPEPLSPEISQNDLMGQEMGWITPSYAKERPLKQLSIKKPPLKPIAVTPKDEGYDRKKLANLANLIDDLEEEEGSRDWQQPEPYRFISESSDDDKSLTSAMPQRKNLYHNVDLDSVYAPEFSKEDNFEPEAFPDRRKNKKKKKKMTRKPPADPVRMKGLEDIYLQRLEGKKKYGGPTPMKFTDGNFFEPEWERTDSAFEYKPGNERALPFAGEEIINPRFKVMTPRKDY